MMPFACFAKLKRIRRIAWIPLETYRQLLDKVTAFKPDVANDLSNAIRLSRIYQAPSALDRRIGNREQAIELDASRMELWQGWLRKLPGNSFVLRQLALVPAAQQ